MASYKIKPTYANKNKNKNKNNSSSSGVTLTGATNTTTTTGNKKVVSSSSSGGGGGGKSSSTSGSSSGYYTDNQGYTYKLNANGTYKDRDGKTRVAYTSLSDIRSGNSPYSDGNGNRISVNYRSGKSGGTGTYTITDKNNKVIKRETFNADLTGDSKKKNTYGSLYRGTGSKSLNNQLVDYVKNNYIDSDDDSKSGTSKKSTTNYSLVGSGNTTNTAGLSTNNQTQYAFGQHPHDKIGDYTFPSATTPQTQNNGGTGIYNGVSNNSTSNVTSDLDLYNKIQSMKNYSQLWSQYDDPAVRKQMALQAQMIGDTISGAYRSNDGVWYNSDGSKLYDTVYKADESNSPIPQGNFLSRSDIQAEYQAMADAQAQARQAQLNALLNELSLQKADVNSAYDDMAREAYINSMQAQTNLPQQLAAQGITGGAAESTMLGLATNYENNLFNNEKARQQQLASIANSETNAKLTADSDIASMQAQANQEAFNAYLNQLNAQNAYNQWAFEVGQNLSNNDWQKQQAEREWAYNMANNIYQMNWNKEQADWQKQQTERENSIADKNNTINWALATGDYSSLGALGIDTSYLEKEQSNKLLQLALEAESQRLANQMAQMQLANYGVRSSGGSSRSTGGSSGRSSSNRTSSVGSSSGVSSDVVSRNQVAQDSTEPLVSYNRPTAFGTGVSTATGIINNALTSLDNPPKYRVEGYSGAFTEAEIRQMIENGSVSAYTDSNGNLVLKYNN